jgi:hypothetical protein
MLLDQLLSLRDLLGLEAIVGEQLQGRLNPELCFAICVLDVYVGSRFLARKEVEPKATNAEDRRTHAPRIA